MLSLFVPLAWLRIEVAGFSLTATMLFAGAVLVYYFLLDLPLGLAMLAVTVALLWLGAMITGLGALQAGTPAGSGG